jgi:hypothetical protein
VTLTPSLKNWQNPHHRHSYRNAASYCGLNGALTSSIHQRQAQKSAKPWPANRGSRKKSATPIRHILKRTDGGTDAARNLEINHLKCHRKQLYAEKDDIFFAKPDA